MHRIQQEKKRQKQNPWTKIQLYSFTCLSKLKYVTYKRQKMLHRMYLCVHSNKLNVFAPSSLFQFNTLQHVKRLFQIKDKSTRQNPKRHIFFVYCMLISVITKWPILNHKLGFKRVLWNFHLMWKFKTLIMIYWYC